MIILNIMTYSPLILNPLFEWIRTCALNPKSRNVAIHSLDFSLFSQIKWRLLEVSRPTNKLLQYIHDMKTMHSCEIRLTLFTPECFKFRTSYANDVINSERSHFTQTLYANPNPIKDYPSFHTLANGVVRESHVMLRFNTFLHCVMTLWVILRWTEA